MEMTESEWMICTDPDELLTHLSDQVSDRKLRLLLCACCRRVWDQLPGERSRRAVRTAEWYADGLASEYELIEARTGAVSAAPRAGAPAAWAVYHATNKRPAVTVRKALTAAAEAGARAGVLDARVG